MMKYPRLVLAALLLAGSCLGESLDISTLGQFFVTPHATGGNPSSCGGFTHVFSTGLGTSTGGAITNTTGTDPSTVSLLVFAVCAPNADGGTLQAGTTSPSITFYPGKQVQSGLTGLTNQMFYATNVSGLTTSTKFWATSAAGASVEFVVEGFSCTGTPLFDTETTGGTATGMSVQPGSGTANGTELFVTSVSFDSGTLLSVDSSFTQEAPSGGGSPNIGYKTSTGTENPTWSASDINHFASSMMLFRSINCSSGGTAFVTSGQGTARHDFDGVVGMAFTPSANITVTDLGRMVFSGNTATHIVYLEDVLGNVLASTTVTTSGMTANTYTYNSITPTSLSSGATYHIVSAEVNGGDDWGNDDATITTTADGSISGSAFAAGPNVNPSTGTSGSHCYGPCNFKYTKP